MHCPEVTILIPVHHDEVAIGADLDVIRDAIDLAGWPYEVIVVGDGSTDGMADVVRARQWVRLLHHTENRGTGAAIMTGIRHAAASVIAITCDDGTYPNHDLLKLIARISECDMVVGARKYERGTLRWLRNPAKGFIRRLGSYLTETRMPDLDTGLRVFKADPAQKFFPLLPNSHSWGSVITTAFLSSGHSVEYVPIDYFERKRRGSHFRPLRTAYSYLLLVVRVVTCSDPLKVFLPLSLLFLFAGFAKLVRDVIVFDWHVPDSTVMIILTGFQLLAIGLIADLIVRRALTWTSGVRPGISLRAGTV